MSTLAVTTPTSSINTYVNHHPRLHIPFYLSVAPCTVHESIISLEREWVLFAPSSPQLKVTVLVLPAIGFVLIEIPKTTINIIIRRVKNTKLIHDSLQYLMPPLLTFVVHRIGHGGTDFAVYSCLLLIG